MTSSSDPHDRTRTGRSEEPLAGGPRDYLLVVEEGSSSIVPLPREGALLIGRDPRAEVRVGSTEASRRHARLVLSPDGVAVSDLGSHNGTLVNGERIHGARALAGGDRIAVGGSEIILCRVTASARRAAAPPPTLLELGDRSVVVADPAMAGIYDLVRRLAASDLPVLLVGETGVGKENAALALHHWSSRRAGPFVTLNCSAIPETLFESELLGYERGAFSGANAAKPGLVEAAEGGTLFLDEIGELSAVAQAKVLRVIETHRVTRLGSVRERRIDLRVVAATNTDLTRAVAEGRFRRDLLFRLGAARVVLPPLRDRPLEIEPLAQALLAEARRRAGRPSLGISTAAMALLRAHRWPGNVRELKGAIEYAAVVAAGAAVEREDLPAELTAPAAAPPIPQGAAGLPRLADEVQEVERRRILEALARAGGVRVRAAALLGVPLRTFSDKLKRLGLDGSAGRPPRRG
jgi:two-component system response regulator AtoC